MYISNFKYYKPKSMTEACRILNECENGAPLAGGTDLLVELKKGMRKISEIISLSEINELKSISEDSGSLSIGAGFSHNRIAGSKIINEKFPALSYAAGKIGSQQVRNTGTLGGNLCTGASCADLAPVLIAYNALAELVSVNGTRLIPLKNFFIFHHKTECQKNEIMTRVIIPEPAKNSGACFVKFGLREASSISVASSAVNISFDSGVCNKISIVIGACAPIPIVSEKANNLINGKSFDDLVNNSELITMAGIAAAEDSLPIDDIRGSAEYRRQLIKVLVKKSLQKAVKSSQLIKN